MKQLFSLPDRCGRKSLNGDVKGTGDVGPVGERESDSVVEGLFEGRQGQEVDRKMWWTVMSPGSL